MRTTLIALALGLSVALIGCPPPGGDAKTTDGGDSTSQPADTGGGETPAEPAAASKAEVDISHVKEGQKYHFKQVAGGQEMQQVWEVTGVTDAEVKYGITTVVAGTSMGPTEATWAIPKPVEAPAAATPADAPEVKMTEETVEIAGMSWACKVVESGGYKTWVPYKSDMPTFPPYVKQMNGAGEVTLELTKIE